MTGKSCRQYVFLALATGALLASAPASSQDQDPEKALARVRAEIEQLERDLNRQIGQRDDGLTALKQVETSLATTRRELAELDRSVAEQRRKQQQIDAERDEANRNLDGERSALGQQIRMSYLTGRQELVKLLLSQEDAADVGRMLVYYDYLNRARSERMAAVVGELETLATLAAESEAVAGELGRLQQAQQDKLARLDREQSQRRELVEELDAAIESDSGRMDRMRAEEAELNGVIERLAEILADFPVNSDAPFADQRGALPWPVEGPIRTRFGAPREGGPQKWDGVLLDAPAGTAVRAVYHGRVAFADWLPRYGLVMILDHGDGYMTLYGHNRALLRALNEWVAPGEPIAEVGDSGGQGGPALYFAIRRNGTAVDPAGWVR